MKNLDYRALLPVFFALLLFLPSCTKEPEEAGTAKKSSLNEDDIALIASLGYDTDSIQELQYGYRVGNGLLISKERLDELRKAPRTKLYYGKNYGFLFPEYQTINMELTPIRGHKTEKSMQAAMQAWNDIPNCRIKFQEGSKDAIRVEFYSEAEAGGVYLVEIEPLLNGKYGHLIRYNELC